MSVVSFWKNWLNFSTQLNAYDYFRSGGGDIIQSLMTRRDVDEWEICGYVRQMLLGLDYLHDRSIGHLGLTVSAESFYKLSQESSAFALIWISLKF